ncbi:MAG TPA: hypothetical protein VLA53_04030 [Nitrosopumilaceae archaeon]|nr:hypothetical protein [Nitrosopumilaceae archaeon]
MSISIGFLYLDTTSGTNLLSKYGIFTGIPSAISGLMFVWFIVKIMSGKKVD